MKQLRNVAFNKVMKHLKGLPFIELKDYCKVTESYEGSENIEIDECTLSFDYLVSSFSGARISCIQVRNNKEDFEYETSDYQWLKLNEMIMTLFNLEEQYNERPEDHAFNIGD